ncbi:MAG: DUF134 domain-containing protein, partial [Candidatus Zixiibacteriota bacterium]
CCRRYQANRIYKPQRISLKDIGTTTLTRDQFEALRLCDSENLNQEQAGQKMGISRGTIQRLLYGARKLIVDAIVRNDAIVINLRKREDCHVSMHTHQRQRRTRSGLRQISG